MLHVSGTTWFQKRCATALLKSHLIRSIELSAACSSRMFETGPIPLLLLKLDSFFHFYFRNPMCCYLGSDSTDGKCCLSGRPNMVFPSFLCLFCSILCKSYLSFIYVPSRRLWHLSTASHFRRLWSLGNKCIWWSLWNSSNFVLYAILGNLLSNILHHSFFAVYFPNSESKQCKGKV